MAEELKKFEFPDKGCCPHCGAKEYTKDEIMDKNPGPGGFVRTHIFCMCSGCSSVFRDPEKYCVSQPNDEKTKESSESDGLRELGETMMKKLFDNRPGEGD